MAHYYGESNDTMKRTSGLFRRNKNKLPASLLDPSPSIDDDEEFVDQRFQLEDDDDLDEAPAAADSFVASRSTHTSSSRNVSMRSANSESRPSYRPSTYRSATQEEGQDDEDVSASLPEEELDKQQQNENKTTSEETSLAQNIEKSAGAQRLNRILSQNTNNVFYDDDTRSVVSSATHVYHRVERIHDIGNTTAVGGYCARVVIPPLKVHTASIGGMLLDSYPANMVQETLVCFKCQTIESTGGVISYDALEYPQDFTRHKRSLGIVGTSKQGRRRFVLLVRSTNRPLLGRQDNRTRTLQRPNTESDTADDYHTMFGGTDDISKDLSLEESNSNLSNAPTNDDKETDEQAIVSQEEEVSSFPVLVCLSLHMDGTGPDIRKLIPLTALTTVQDLHATVVQLAFDNGDTLRLDFGDDEKVGSLDKERFIWCLLQTHAILCQAVVERSYSNTTKDRFVLPPLSVRNLDRAELQYVATVNGFLKESEALVALLERQREQLVQEDEQESKGEVPEMEGMAYNLMMGKFASRISIFQSEEERKDAEEILNQSELTESLRAATAASVAEQLGLMLQERMHDLEAETCRRLIAWEDEKYSSHLDKKGRESRQEGLDTVDALALASLFRMLESLDAELKSMEDWLQERAATIKPLTDDCADIEEENRQLEQQWKSYDMLGAEMRRLLTGLNLDQELEKVLKNPASALVYDDDGLVDDEASDAGIEQIYKAGKALQEAMEYPKRSGGMHLRAVAERAEGLVAINKGFCKQLAQIIVTMMEQFKTEVVAGSDHGKVSKNDTHAMIAKKIRDTQRKFQSALLGYIKLIEILAALSPEMLPALRDAYAEMVAEGILMKKRCKGYFQALPGNNLAYMNPAGMDIRDYVPFDDSTQQLTLVNASDIRSALSELLPVVAREAYFVSALFGSSTKDLDGREKKRNFENARKAVDDATQHFRYYIFRTCGIHTDDLGQTGNDSSTKGDPLLCLVASICLHESMDPYIDREKKGGDHSLSLAYVRATILDFRKKADKVWISWVERQLEWIKTSDGVPLSGKRAGVFASFARFPCYIDHVLKCCREGKGSDYTPDLDNIKVVSYYFQKMAQALLDSVQECANRETTDQQYAANVMLMENTYFFTQAIKQRGDVISELLDKQVTKANAICKESTDAYLGWMIKREFTALHDLFSKISKLRKELGDKEVATHVPKAQFVRVLSKEAGRDMLKEKIGSMYSRMEKHMSEEGGLLPVAWKALVKVLFEWFGRWEKLSSTIYGHKLVPTAVDVVRIAKAVGGEAQPNNQSHSSEFGFKSILALGKHETISK